MTQAKHGIDMTTGAILPKMLKFTLPLMLSSILQLLFNAADVIVVGNFASDNSLAAVGSTTALVNLMTNLFLGLSTGANVLSAHYMGAGDDQRVSRTVHTSITLSIVSGLIMTVVGVLFADKLLGLMDTPDEVIGLSTLYLRIYFAGMVAMMIYNFGSSLLRSKGDTKRPLYYLALAGVINVVLNMIFVIFFKMDVAGVALATVISQCVSAFLVVRCLMKETDGFKLILKKLGIDKQIMIKILRIGIPAGFQGVVFSLSNVVIQSSINGFGPIVMAANSAAASIEGFVWVSMNAFSQAAISFVSQNIGAGKGKRAYQGMMTVIGMALSITAVLAALIYIFAEPAVGLFSADPAVIEYGVMFLHQNVFFMLFNCINQVSAGAMRGRGDSRGPMVLLLMGFVAVRQTYLFIVTRFVANTAPLVGFGYPVGWMATCFFLVVYFLIRWQRGGAFWNEV